MSGNEDISRPEVPSEEAVQCPEGKQGTGLADDSHVPIPDPFGPELDGPFAFSGYGSGAWNHLPMPKKI